MDDSIFFFNLNRFVHTFTQQHFHTQQDPIGFFSQGGETTDSQFSHLPASSMMLTSSAGCASARARCAVPRSQISHQMLSARSPVMGGHSSSPSSASLFPVSTAVHVMRKFGCVSRSSARSVSCASMPAGATIAITGGTGLVGSHLAAKLTAAGNKCIVLTRDATKAKVPAGVDVAGPNDWTKALGRSSAVVNLAGEPIATRCACSYVQVLCIQPDAACMPGKHDATPKHACSKCMHVASACMAHASLRVWPSLC